MRQEFCDAALNLVEMALLRGPLGLPVKYPDPKDLTWASVNEAAAGTALLAIRYALHDHSTVAAKSTNKWPKHCEVDPRTIPTGTIDLASMEGRLVDDVAAAERLAFAKASVEAWLGLDRNCAALCFAAQDYLAKHFSPVQTAMLAFHQDHVVLVVGSMEKHLVDRPLSKWPPHVYICDPWANIACQAKDYPELFQKKMNKWAEDGKRVISSDMTNEWQSPLDWSAVPDRIDHVDIRQFYESGQSTVLRVAAKPRQGNLVARCVRRLVQSLSGRQAL